ncbi:hypothetical protein FSP39_023195 [Pinctada imbricata]|uniref:alkaline phosphatase n=1 Tax=Pinctada imbricata TaxID=66713 RepID=A0AA88YI69_PINIB|nr:hypothetical protein FSP39_023195 [Pinctada imbricata]
MGVSTLTTARILKGQLKGKTGEEEQLTWDKFPHSAFSKTYNQDHQTPDSAGTATAFLAGVKTNKGVIGVDARVKRGDCSTTPDTKLYSIGKLSLEKGKKVGFVTTTRVTHATPAALYAHTPERDWEGDDEKPSTGADDCKDIATQLVDENQDISVIMGGGRRYFLPQTMNDFERGSNSNSGRRDGRNLIEAWEMSKRDKNQTYRFVWNSTGFNSVDPHTTDYLLGLFESSHMQYEADRKDPSKETAGEPSLAEMTEKAIGILRKDPDGFFLLVEAGRIDHGHHATKAYLALHDTLAFDDAVAKAVEMTSEQDTLIIVTADHSHTFAMGGYPTRGNPIFGLTDKDGKSALDNNKKTYTTLVYGNGPGYQDVRQNLTENITCKYKTYTTLVYGNGPGYQDVRQNLTEDVTWYQDIRQNLTEDVPCKYKTYTTLMYGNGPGFKNVRQNLTEDVTCKYKTYTTQDTAFPLDSETHGGEDVGIFARGPFSHLFHGVREQNYIAHVMAFASCVGRYKDDKDCAASYKQPEAQDDTSSNPAPNVRMHCSLIIFISLSKFVFSFLSF